MALAGSATPLFPHAALASPGGAALAGVAAGSCSGPPGFGSQYMGSTWPGGFNGVPVYSNGISGSFTDCLHSTKTPSGRYVVDGYEWQCVELVVRLYLTKGWISSTWLGNGDQLFSTAPRGLAKQAQGSISDVHPGDVVTFNAPGGGAGHAAVVSQVQGDYLTIVNQNTDYGAMISHAYLQHGSIEMVGWPGWGPIGVIHAPASATAPPPLQVVTHSLPAARVDAAYKATLGASGGTGHDSWSLRSGRLPGGLHLARDGAVYGTALAVGRFGVTVAVRDSKGATATGGLSLDVSSSSNLLSDGDFRSRGASPWRAVGLRSTIRHGAVGVPGFGRLGSELVLSSGRSSGSVYEDVRTTLENGHSFSLGVWARKVPTGGSSTAPQGRPAKICVVVRALPHVRANHTCTAVGTRWTWIVAPFDVTRAGESVLRAEVYVDSAPSRVAFARATLFGNALLHASFQSRDTANWSTMASGSADEVRDPALARQSLPEGADVMRVTTSAGGGSVFQDIAADATRGQQFRFSAWMRAVTPGASGAEAERSAARVCLVVWGTTTHQEASECAAVDDAWAKVSVAFTAGRFERGLRAQVYVLTAGQAVLLDGTELVNTTP